MLFNVKNNGSFEENNVYSLNIYCFHSKLKIFEYSVTKVSKIIGLNESRFRVIALMVY